MKRTTKKKMKMRFIAKCSTVSTHYLGAKWRQKKVLEIFVPPALKHEIITLNNVRIGSGPRTSD